MAENPNTHFVGEICTMMSSCFPGWLGLLVHIRIRLHVHSKCACARKVSGQNSTSPTACYGHEGGLCLEGLVNWTGGLDWWTGLVE